MNISFTLADSKLDGEFLKGAEARGMVQLKGHRAVGGMRASICTGRWRGKSQGVSATSSTPRSTCFYLGVAWYPSREYRGNAPLR
jgi:hypothetical protein